MANATNPSVPSHYVLRAKLYPAKAALYEGQVACRDCGRWAHAGERIRHASDCDVAPRQSVLPGAAAAAPTESDKDKRDRKIIRAVRGGYASLVASDEEVLGMVRSGRVSVSDAMNQDF